VLAILRKNHFLFLVLIFFFFLETFVLVSGAGYLISGRRTEIAPIGVRWEINGLLICRGQVLSPNQCKPGVMASGESCHWLGL